MKDNRTEQLISGLARLSESMGKPSAPPERLRAGEGLGECSSSGRKATQDGIVMRSEGTSGGYWLAGGIECHREYCFVR
jgi:hypothetical protein